MGGEVSLAEQLSVVERPLNHLMDRLQGVFSNPSTHAVACHYIKGLLRSIERKNSWQLSEAAGLSAPYRIQYLLGRAHWDADAVRDMGMEEVQRILGCKRGTLIVDETGFLKKGKESAGVSRQYSGTAGRIENCQIGVFLSWATSEGAALIDRELYIPQEWHQNPERCGKAHIPKERTFCTKLQLAQQMIERALKAGFLPAWVVADEVYGHSSDFRHFLEEHHLSYVLNTQSNQMIYYEGKRRPAANIHSFLQDDAWVTLSCGAGSKGPRDYQWATVPLTTDASCKRWLLFRRHPIRHQEVAYYLAFTSTDTPLHDIVQAVGQRWHIEECFQSAKGEVGLDQYEVRNYTGWYRHITLSMLAHTFLLIAKNNLPPPQPLPSTMLAFKKKRGL